jgi:ATP:ADP antiporter, AAA family
MSLANRLSRAGFFVPPAERGAVSLAFACNFFLMGSYYILRPLRDTVATVVGVDHLQTLFTGTFIGTFVASALYLSLTSRIRLATLLPGVFWFWLSNLVAFAELFRYFPHAQWLAAAFYIWFSVVNLFMISVFWSLIVDVFSVVQATRSFALIAGGGALGAIAGPLLTRLLVGAVGVSGLLLWAAAGFALVIALIYQLMREKRRLRGAVNDSQQSRLDQALPGNVFDGFRQIVQSSQVRAQAAFMLLMTWVNTVAYFCQTDLITRSYPDIVSRAQAIADIDLAVNAASAAILFLGMGRLVQRFGVTVGLLLNPLVLIVGFALMALSPTLFVIQALQVVRRVGQYAVARPSREICFTLVDQNERYQAKNVVDTVLYRFGDLSSAWMQAGMRSMGFGVVGTAALGIVGSLLWGVSALSLGRRFEGSRSVAHSRAAVARVGA